MGFSGGEGGRGFSGGMGDVLDDIGLDTDDTGCCLLTILLLPLYAIFKLIEYVFENLFSGGCGCFGVIVGLFLLLIIYCLLFGG